MRKYNPNTKAYFNVPSTQLEQLTIGGQTVTVATYQISDGGELDMDEEENSEIVDPVGLGVQEVGVANTGLGSVLGFLSKF